MSKPQLLPSGRWRAQKMRGGKMVLDRVYDTQAEAQSAIDAFEVGTGTVRAVLEAYLQSAAHADKTPQTQKTERSRLQSLAETKVGHIAFGDFLLREITKQLINRLFEQRARTSGGSTRTTGTRRTEFGILSSMLSWSVEQGFLATNPARDAKRPKKSLDRSVRVGRATLYNLEQAAEDEKQPPELRRAAWFFVLMDYLGCRPGELAALKVVDIKPEDEVLIFRATKDGRKDRARHLDPELLKRLERVRPFKGEVYLFERRQRQTKLPAPAGYSDYAKLVRKAKLVPAVWHPHAHRREFISSAIEHGAPIDDIMKVSGHRHYATVKTYDQSARLHSDVRSRLDDLAKKRELERDAALFRMMESNPEVLKELLRNAGVRIPNEVGEADRELEDLLASIPNTLPNRR